MIGLKLLYLKKMAYILYILDLVDFSWKSDDNHGKRDRFPIITMDCVLCHSQDFSHPEKTTLLRPAS